MNKEEIFEKLNELDLDKEKYIVISGASLTVQGITSISSDIDLSCSEEYYKTIDWETKNGYFNTEIKYRDCYEIGTNFYDTDNIVVINGYKFTLANDTIVYEYQNDYTREFLTRLLEVISPLMKEYFYYLIKYSKENLIYNRSIKPSLFYVKYFQ